MVLLIGNNPRIWWSGPLLKQEEFGDEVSIWCGTRHEWEPLNFNFWGVHKPIKKEELADLISEHFAEMTSVSQEYWSSVV